MYKRTLMCFRSLTLRTRLCILCLHCSIIYLKYKLFLLTPWLYRISYTNFINRKLLTRMSAGSCVKRLSFLFELKQIFICSGCLNNSSWYIFR